MRIIGGRSVSCGILSFACEREKSAAPRQVRQNLISYCIAQGTYTLDAMPLFPPPPQDIARGIQNYVNAGEALVTLARAQMAATSTRVVAVAYATCAAVAWLLVAVGITRPPSLGYILVDTAFDAVLIVGLWRGWRMPWVLARGLPAAGG